MTGALKTLFEPEVYRPVADTYCNKLRSHIGAQQFASHTTRQTPRFLPIVATPDVKHDLERGWEGDIAILRWDVMNEYFDSADF